MGEKKVRALQKGKDKAKKNQERRQNIDAQ